MNKITNRRYLDLAIGVLAALAGFLLAGCGPSESLHYTDAGAVYCDIPSPLGEAVDPSTKLTYQEEARFVVVSNASDYAKLCEGWNFAKTCNGGDQAGCKVETSELGVTSNECGAAMTSAECSDPAHDLVDSVGVKHCYVVKADDGTSNCMVDPSGKTTCRLTSLDVMARNGIADGGTALCSPGGVFLGWACR